MKSIGQRLRLQLMTGLAGLMIAGALILYPSVRAILLSEFDYALLAKARALTTLPEPGREGINLSFAQAPLPEFQSRPDAEFFQVWLRDGSPFARSPSLETADLPHRVGPENAPEFFDLTLPDGRPGRAVGIGFVPDANELEEPEPGAEAGARYTVSMVLARDTVRLQRTLHGLLGGILIGGTGLVGMMAWVVGRGTRAGLRPVRDLADQVRGIDARTLETRWPVGSLPEELRPIGEQLNRMMARLLAAFDRERQFTANAAHELLTPIAELRSLAEAALKWREDTEATGEFAAEVLDSAQQMEHLARALLSLARMEAGMADVRIEPVNLAELLDEVRQCFDERISVRRLSMRWNVPGKAQALTDYALCRAICFNLLDNAVEYTPAGGVIECEVAPHEHGLRMTLGNTAQGLDPGDLPRLFEPLWRKDKARTARAHAGLGLPLASAYAKALGMRFGVTLPREDRFEVILDVPAGSPEGVSSS
jgi:signal transduction histidine kinase